MNLRLSKITRFLILTAFVLSAAGCVYYNTFFNAKQAFNEAEKYRKEKGVGSQGGYQTAIDKSLMVIENHPNSRYYPEALYVLGVSYYYTNQYAKSDRRLRELLANYPESKYAKEATLYLARSKLKLEETDEAFKAFEEIFEGKYSKEYRAEAALALGDYHKDQKDYAQSEKYYSAVRDSLGNDAQKRQAQLSMANSYFDAFKFADALSAYLKLLDMKPEKNDKYLALTQAALCSYRLQRITNGLNYLNKLIKDPIFYDSLGALNLSVAQGYEYAGDLLLAETAYEDVATTTRVLTQTAEAYYRLGLMYQYDYDDLTKAKFYYDKSAEANRGTEAGKDALQRASDIAKMQTLTKSAEEALAAEEREAQKKSQQQTAKPDTLGRSIKALTDSTLKSAERRDAIKDSVAAALKPVDSLKDTTAAHTKPVDSLRDTTVTHLKSAGSLVDTTAAPLKVVDSLRDTSAVHLKPVDSLRDIAAQLKALNALRDTAAAHLKPVDSLNDTTAAHFKPADSLGGAATAHMKPEIKVDTARARLDSLAAEQQAQDRIDNAANTQFQLAELFWLQLNKPDSAINELKFLLQHYPTAENAPRAQIALSQMYRDYLADTLGADSILKELLASHPHSDYVPDALDLLKLRGAPADTGYAQRYLDKAEDFLIDSSNVDSALYYYQYVVDHFEDSKYYQQARFSLIWVKEMYRSPGDSSIAIAYKQFADSFPGTPYAQEAIRKLTAVPAIKPLAKPKAQDSLRSDTAANAGIQQAQLAQPADTASPQYTDPLTRYQIGPKGEPLILLDLPPIETTVDFEYPTEAYNLEGTSFYLYYQILLDFSGRVVDYALKSPTLSAELNRRANATIASMTFDPLAVNKQLVSKSIDITLPENQADPRGRWYLYKYIVEKPGHVR